MAEEGGGHHLGLGRGEGFGEDREVRLFCVLFFGGGLVWEGVCVRCQLVERGLTLVAAGVLSHRQSACLDGRFGRLRLGRHLSKSKKGVCVCVYSRSGQRTVVHARMRG